MKAPRLVIAFALVAVSAAPAAADGFYFSESLGVASFHGELGAYVPDEAFRIRIGGGYRTGRIALEAYAAANLAFAHHGGGASDCGRCGKGEVVARPGPSGDPGEFGLDLKLIQPLSTHWSAYARGGLSYMTVGDSDYGGRGVGATAGIQVAGRVPALGFLWWPLFFLGKGPRVHSALFFEAGSSFHRLHGDGPTVDAHTTSWTLGFAVGQDF